jgi:hypothetical protein
MGMNVFTSRYITRGDTDDLIIFPDQVSFGDIFGGYFVTGTDVSIGNDVGTVDRFPRDEFSACYHHIVVTA